MEDPTRLVDEVQHKTCTKCGVSHPATTEFYYSSKTGEYGVHPQCKNCRKENTKSYREANKEKHEAYEKSYKEANAEKLRSYAKAYRQTHKIVRSDHSKKSNREARRRRKARLRENGFEFYTEQQVLDSYGTDCHLCGTPVDLEAPRSCGTENWERGLHIDHVVPISKGGPDTLENVRPAHGLCNIRKSDSLILDSSNINYGKVEFPS